MDIFYEESAGNQNEKRGQKAYNVVNAISKIFLFLTVFFGIMGVLTIPTCSPESYEGVDMDAYNLMKFFCITCLCIALIFGCLTFYFSRLARLCNVSYDYAFVSGELRIAKVFGGHKRRLVAKFDCNDIIQIGKVDSASYERFSSAPDVKIVYCTGNKEAAEDKMFIYILAAYNGKKLFVLECREMLIAHILKFAKRSVLATDYQSK